MTVAVEVVASPDTWVSDAAARSHTARGATVLLIPLIEMVHASVGVDVASVRSVVAIEDRTVELVIDEGPFEALGPAVWALAARGWKVVTLTPSHRNGEAHRALRGTPCHLQTWWQEGSAVRFGAFERP